MASKQVEQDVPSLVKVSQWNKDVKTETEDYIKMYQKRCVLA